VWIAPKKDKTYFGEITDEEIADISVLLQRMIRRLEVIYKGGIFSSLPFGYNFYIYPKENWYLRIIPRFIHKAGFELGTGLNVNIVDPKTAAVDLRADTMVSVLEKLKKFKE
jgi:galactose-1-phosphate uridylyltransferase